MIKLIAILNQKNFGAVFHEMCLECRYAWMIKVNLKWNLHSASKILVIPSILLYKIYNDFSTINLWYLF